jgi:hypothetical protein
LPATMDDAPETKVPSEPRPATGNSVIWQPVRFLLHLSAVYAIAKYGVPWLSAWTRGTLLPFLQRPTSSSSFEFLFSHIVALSLIPALIAGLANARFKHKVAWFVWLVPAAILTYMFLTFPTPSVFQSQLAAAWHEYFGGGFSIADFRGSAREFVMFVGSNPDIRRGLAQLNITAPFYAGFGYSLAAWIGQRASLADKLGEKVKSWEDSRFGDRA